MARFAIQTLPIPGDFPRWPAIALAAFALLVSQPFTASAASAPAADNRVQGLSGFWRLKDRGSAKPALTDWAKAEMLKTPRAGDIDIEAVRWCVSQGMPYVMGSAGPIDIRQAGHETAILAERIAEPRHIYFKLERPDPDSFDFAPTGNSIGRRVDDVLVVETMMFSPGVGPEGAPRTEETRLVERFRVLNGGKELSVTATWTDPKVFVTPYVHTWTYERLPEGYTAEAHYCDPRQNGVGNHPTDVGPREGANAE